jgi:Putative collagen-binding domain of a collagenase/Protein of unknown function (DUF4038)
MRHHLRLLLPLVLLISSCLPVHSQAQIRAPLRVHPQNPRYFTDGSGKAIYLTGSHTWCNLSNYYFPGNDETCNLDWTAYLNFLTQHNHNFIRMWRFELTGMEIHPWQRSGPGTANDGKPKINFNQFNKAYFDRLRQRIIDARDRGIYVGIMLFDGSFSESFWDEHIFNPNNNAQGIDGGGSDTQTLNNSQKVAVQEAYIKKVIDTVNDLDNVLYEISNESNANSVQWQYHMINLVKSYEAGKPKQHPVGMTATYPDGTMADLLNSPADWISPGGDVWDDYRDDPPAADGRKVIITDTDHTGVSSANKPETVWKNFTRGNQTILMEGPDLVSDSTYEPARKAAGQTLTYANKMSLAAMTPQGSLSSTGYALAKAGSEYLVYQPNGGSFTVNLQSATYQVEWFNPNSGQTSSGGTVSGGGSKSFTPPFAGAAVLWLLRPDAVVAMPAPRNLRLIGNNK